MTSDAQFVVLCEDLQSQVFIRRALIRWGAHPRRIRTLPLPSGGMAGDLYVRQKYPIEVKDLRARASKTALLVHIDADPTHTVAQRRQELADALEAASIGSRRQDEPIALLIPKRNIETWIHLLNGVVVDEANAYPKLRDRQSECRPMAEAFADHARRRTVPTNSTPSLDSGLNEFRRLP